LRTLDLGRSRRPAIEIESQSQDQAKKSFYFISCGMASCNKFVVPCQEKYKKSFYSIEIASHSHIWWEHSWDWVLISIYLRLRLNWDWVLISYMVGA